MEGVVFTGKADRFSSCSKAGRTSDAMHIVRRLLRQVKIDDVSDIGNMETARCHVCCYENGYFTIMETPHQRLPLFLRHTPRNGCRVKTVGVECAFDKISRRSRICEHHDPPTLELSQQAGQQRKFLFVCRVVNGLVNIIRRHSISFHFEQFRFIHVLVGKFQHPLRQRCRKHQALPLVQWRQPS